MAKKKSAKDKREQRKAAAQRNNALQQQLDERVAANAMSEATSAHVEYVPEESVSDIVMRVEQQHEDSSDAAMPTNDGRSNGRQGGVLNRNKKRQQEGLSKKKQRDALRSSIAEVKLRLLRQMGPDGITFAKTVERRDHNGPNPMILAQLKGTKNSVPVPPHWEQKRAFMSEVTDREEGQVVPASLRGINIEKFKKGTASVAQFTLSAIRSFLTVHPKDHRKPEAPMTKEGDVYFMQKSSKHAATPGVISDDLRRALGMNETDPPPWLYEQQRIAALPPNLKHARYPGLNAPIPLGCQWGRAQGQWGMPPTKANKEHVFPEVLGDPTKAPPPPPRAWGDTKGMPPPVLELDHVIDTEQNVPQQRTQVPQGVPPPMAAKARVPPPEFRPSYQQMPGAQAVRAAAPPVAAGVKEYREAGVTSGTYAAAKLQAVAPRNNMPPPPRPAPKPKAKPTSTSTKF